MTTLGLLVLLVALLPVALYTAAREWKQAAFVPQDMMVFLVRGASLHKIIANIAGHHYDPVSQKVVGGPETRKGISGFLVNRFGIFWGSILYPLIRFHEFRIDASRLLPESQRVGKPMTQWIERAEQPVKGLLWRFHHPFLLENVELKDNYAVNVLVFVMFEVVNPHLPVFTYRGKFFEQLAAAIEGRVGEYLNDSAYSEFIELDKGQGGKFTPELLKINGPRNNVPEGIESRFGIKSIDGWIVAQELSGASIKQQEAVIAEETEKLLAKGRIAKADGEAQAIERLTLAQADNFNKLISELVNKGNVSPDAAAHLVAAKIVSENIRDSSLTTFAGGSSLLAISPKD